jgi:hypothetical protein
MNRIIITLALVALASTAWAQATPEVTLPQYLPPSYSSPHGGTGMDFTHHIKPHTPNITAPNTGGGAPSSHFLDAVTKNTDHGAKSRMEAAKTRHIEICYGRGPGTGFDSPECKQAAADKDRTFNEWWESFKRTMDAADKEAQRRQKAYIDEATERNRRYSK